MTKSKPPRRTPTFKKMRTSQVCLSLKRAGTYSVRRRHVCVVWSYIREETPPQRSCLP
jgi:hypothetical protein